MTLLADLEWSQPQHCRYCVAARTCGSRTRKPHVRLGVFTSNPMLEQAFVKGPKHSSSWFAEGQEGAGVDIGTFQ
jgi:hypothetical protein